jgi:hypothetical protein
MYQKGFFGLGITGYVAIAGAILVTGLSAALYIQTLRLDSANARYNTFKASQITLAKAAADAAAKKAAEDRAAKEKADEDHVRTVAELSARIKRLRDARNRSGSGVPTAPATSTSPAGQACFARPELERAYGELVAEVRRLADEGDSLREALRAAREWARDAGMK